ncbi:hypothetical protein PFICI_06451 [Pestalotiopsis fici W106-1]|uniref:Kelch repeat protein n=1 Tax=Pestalotiopsis fici (strain W106-1 / CGMCC3.15140) TaxID=1229662 RepID=W3X5Z1_PESFW|nr:uncharacterized protein PFICI_06451 [Pestalotiopsis fici W106-1]ETS81449.1 hypothetical protein PFICI_06451 [Pestalotiopsis fici W106-1]
MHSSLQRLAILLLVLPRHAKSYDVPPVDAYFRRMGHSIVVIGDYLYVQGGEISWDAGNGTAIGQFSDIYANRVNKTLSLPIAESWNNATVQWIETDSVVSAPSLRLPALWPQGDSFFTWGGSKRFGLPVEDSLLWQFTTDGAGGGNWTSSQPANMETFSSIRRTTAAARASCRGVGLYLGGYAAPQTDVAFNDDTKAFPVPGLLTYDMETATWSNKTSKPGLNNYGTSVYGAATCLEDYGNKGVFITIGGQMETDLSAYSDNGLTLFETSTLSLYDVDADQWLKQKVSGEAPEQRDRTCLSTAHGQNGSLDIYMYGGIQKGGTDQVNKVFDDIWILSIPAFTWFKLNVTGTQRSWHDCVIIGSQLVSVGGLGAGVRFNESVQFNDRDEWRQGLGVLDLASMTWADGFNANSTAYESPQVVKDWYRDNDFRNNNWTSDDVKQLFTNSAKSTNSTNTTDPIDAGTVASEADGQKISIGSIVGGVIGGVVALVAILGTGFWYMRRRKSKNSKASTAIDTPNEGKKEDPLRYWAETHTQQWYYAELNGRPGLFQLPSEGSERPAELGPHAEGHIPIERRRGISELSGSSPEMKG